MKTAEEIFYDIFDNVPNYVNPNDVIQAMEVYADQFKRKSEGIDYKELLKKYLLHLIDVEGDILVYRQAMEYKLLTDTDIDELCRLLVEATKEHPI